MRTLILSSLLRIATPVVGGLAAATVIAACGPSSKEVATAKQARYQGDKSVLFNAAKTAAENKEKLGKVDEGALGFQTGGKWYSQDGMVTAGQDANIQNVPDRSIRLTLVVRLVPDGEHFLVSVEPVMFRRISGSPQPEPMDPKDASIPGFVQGQVDAMQFEIWNALKQYEVKSPGGIAPAPTAPAPAPAAAPAPDAAATPSGDPAAPAPATP